MNLSWKPSVVIYSGDLPLSSEVRQLDSRGFGYLEVGPRSGAYIGFRSDRQDQLA